MIILGRFYGLRENEREVEMDMREMTDRVKAGLPVYGNSRLTDYMQGVAARQTRYTALFLHVIPWFNFVNHPHVSDYLSQSLECETNKIHSME